MVILYELKILNCINLLLVVTCTELWINPLHNFHIYFSNLRTTLYFYNSLCDTQQWMLKEAQICDDWRPTWVFLIISKHGNVESDLISHLILLISWTNILATDVLIVVLSAAFDISEYDFNFIHVIIGIYISSLILNFKDTFFLSF